MLRHANDELRDQEQRPFLSPDFSDTEQEKPNQGASPALRRSNRKRKSATGPDTMTRGSGLKKKKNSPNKSSASGGVDPARACQNSAAVAAAAVAAATAKSAVTATKVAVPATDDTSSGPTIEDGVRVEHFTQGDGV